MSGRGYSLRRFAGRGKISGREIPESEKEMSREGSFKFFYLNLIFKTLQIIVKQIIKINNLG